MKKFLLFICSLAFVIILQAQRVSHHVFNIIPQPVSVLEQPGMFILPYRLTIITPVNKEVRNIAAGLAERISISKQYKVTTKEGNSAVPKSIFLALSKDKSIPGEGYRLKITANGISIIGSSPAGIFYGVQTLYQLFPGQIVSKTKVDKQWTIPAVTIEDYPRFGWRGVLLDVVRHWFTKEQVKEFIDNMVQFKFNVLHLHLSDDQGWRLEIKSLPKLTEVGAWRAPRIGRWGEFSKPTPDEPKTYGGFYTQDDMRELIQYAGERYVMIVPEIDVPGHSLAAVASYPELSCTTDSTYEVNAGNRFMIWPGNGTFYGTLDNTVCPANEKVYEFLDKVFTEVAQVFHCPYIHMGGDECYKGYWEKSEACKQLMQREGLKNVQELQSYFTKRVSAIISSKGKKMMGWDEIMEGGLADSAVVMSWQGMKGGTAAAAAKHDVVMSPNDYAYVDLYQGDPVAEPPTYSMLRLNKAYQFDPLPPGVDSQYILGGQCNLWSERLYTMRHAEYMLWPRGLAIAESVWSPKEKKNWNDFVRRVEDQFKRFDIAGIKYARSMYDPIFTALKDSSGQLQIQLSTEIEGLTIHYSFDETFPDNFYPVYTAPLSVPKDAANLKVVTYRGKEQVGKIINMPVAELKKRAKIN